jgi:signal transduction histidine kinase
MKELNLRNVKHELRTPVNHILGYSELLLESAQDAGDEILVRQARSIHADGRKLVDLIDKSLASADQIQPEHMNVIRTSFGAVLDQIVRASTPNSSSQWLGSYAGDLEKIRLAARRLTLYLQNLDTFFHP